MNLFIIVFILISVSKIGIGQETTLDLGLVIQGEPAKVYVEKDSITLQLRVDEFKTPASVNIDGESILVTEAIREQLETLVNQHLFARNLQRRAASVPIILALYSVIYSMLEDILRINAAFKQFDKAFYNETLPELNITAWEASDLDCKSRIEGDADIDKLRSVYRMLEEVQDDHNNDFAAIKAAAADGTMTYTTEKTDAQVEAFGLKMAPPINLAATLLHQIRKALCNRLELLQSAQANKNHHMFYSVVAESTKCWLDWESEEVSVAGMQEYRNGVLINYTVTPFTRIGDHSYLHAIPYMVRGEAFQVELSEPVVIQESSGFVLDPQRCTLAEGIYHCRKNYLTSDDCVQHALDTITTVPEQCDVEKLEPNKVPLIVNTPSGTLVAQRSTHPVHVIHGSSRVRQDPVVVQGPLELIINYAQGSRKVSGQPGSTFGLRASPWEGDERDVFYYQYSHHYIYKYVPDSYQDYAFLILGIAQLCLIIPAFWKIFKFSMRCCGYNWDARPPRWLLVLRNWEIPFRSDATAPATEEESFPLRNLTPRRAADLFVNLARDAKTLAIEEFLGKYDGDEEDLRNFYTRARSGPPVRSRGGVRLV